VGFDGFIFDPDSGMFLPSSQGSEHHFCSLIIYGVDPAFLSVVTGSMDLKYYPLVAWDVEAGIAVGAHAQTFPSLLYASPRFTE